MEIRIDSELREGINEAVHKTDKDSFRAYAVIGGQFDESFTALSENEVASLRFTSSRAAHTNPRDSSGVEILPSTAAKQLADGHNVTVDNALGLNAANVKLSDKSGFSAQINPNSQIQTNEPYRLSGSIFHTSIDTKFWTAENSGTGSASGVANSIASMVSGTSNSGYGKLRTVSAARFLFAHPHKFRSSIRLPVVNVANNTRRWGAVSLSTVTPQDGVFFSVSSAGALSVNWVSGGGSINTVSSGSFNGDVSSVTLDTSIHAYEIIYFTMGIWFYVDGVLIHKVTPTTSILYTTLSVPINMWSVNSAGGVTSGTLECWNTVISRLGRFITSPTSFFQSGSTAGEVLKLSAGTLRGLVVSEVSNNSVVTLYDNTAASGTIIWSSGQMSANITPYDLDFKELDFFVGLTLAIPGSGSNVLVIYE